MELVSSEADQLQDAGRAIWEQDGNSCQLDPGSEKRKVIGNFASSIIKVALQPKHQTWSQDIVREPGNHIADF